MRKLFEQLISWLLVVTFALQPVLLQAQAIPQEPVAGIQVVGSAGDQRARVQQSDNGITVLNIATPNGAGVSHDVYQRFEADDLILNNSGAHVETRQGGWIERNPNLAPGQAADLWIGEVVGGSQTQLNGILEVAGPELDVVLANEFGVTCQGCGFINTGRTTLTTGRPVFAADGGLAQFDVRRGMVTIGADGLNPESELALADTARVDVIARAASIYGAMRADQINLVTGANRVTYDWSYNPDTGEVVGIQAQTGEGAPPALAVDVAALGGMYANAIKMIATEAGVGVRLDGRMASSSNLSIRADGQLMLGAPPGQPKAQISAQNNLRIRNRAPILLEGALTTGDGGLVDVRTTAGGLTLTGQIQAGAVVLEGAGLTTIAGAIAATGRARLASSNDQLVSTADADVAADEVSLAGRSMTLNGEIRAQTQLQATTSQGDLAVGGTLSSQATTLTAARDVVNRGTIAGGQRVAINAGQSLRNAATVISGDDLAVQADQILNNGGVLWANDTITLTGQGSPADLVQNTNGRIEAFQGDLTIRAREVANLGTAPVVEQSEIRKWVEEGDPIEVDPVAEIVKLIEPTYLDENDQILPAYLTAYTALWADLVTGGTLSAEAQRIVKSSVRSPSGTAISDNLVTLWTDMSARAGVAGTGNLARHVQDLIAPEALAPNGSILPQHSQAYADLWEILAAGDTEVPDNVKAILAPDALVLDSEVTDPVTLVTTRTYSNRLTSGATDVWAAATSEPAQSYDVIKILESDYFADDGQLAEMIAGAHINISGDIIRNIYGNMSAGGDITLDAEEVTNHAFGATQLLFEVHKKPGCFTCHEGQAAFADTFGGRIEAQGNIGVTGNLTNHTVSSSEHSVDQIISRMNTFIAAQQAAGDADLAGTGRISHKSLEFHDERAPETHSAPVAGNGADIRTIVPHNTGGEAENAALLAATPVVQPALDPIASVEELLSNGLTTITETNPEFTDYADFITSNHMMDVDRLQYRDDLLNNGREQLLTAATTAGDVPHPAAPDFLDRTFQVPSRDGNGLTTLYPAQAALQFGGSRGTTGRGGAEISGTSVTLSGERIVNSGQISGEEAIAVTATSLSGAGGGFTSETGNVALTARDGIVFENISIEGASVDLVSGGDLIGRALALTARKDASLYASGQLTLGALAHSYEITRSKPASPHEGADDPEAGGPLGIGGNRPEPAELQATNQFPSSLAVEGNLAVVSEGDLALDGVSGDIGGAAAFAAEGDLRFAAVEDSYNFHQGNSKNGTDVEIRKSYVTDLTIGADMVATAGGSALLIGTEIDAGGTLEIGAADDLIMAATQDLYRYSTRKSKSGFMGFRKKSSSTSTTKVTNQGVRLAARDDLSVIAEAGSLQTAGTQFASGRGDISLSATAGDIYAGSYTDVFKTETKRSSGLFWGLLSSSTERSSIDHIKTGTEALAALDLSLVSGTDTTLVGANLSAGGSLNINTGGDFSVQAAINSHREQMFSSDMGLVLMTVIQESSFVESAVYTQLLAGGALNLAVEGNAALAVYEQSGIDPPNPSDLYPEELLALEGLDLLRQDLANEYFYDKQQSLSPAFKVLVALAVAAYAPQFIAGWGAPAVAAPTTAGTAVVSSTAFGTTVATTTVSAAGVVSSTYAYSLTALGSAASASISSVITGGLDAIVSGDFDLGDILGNAFKEGLTAGVTAGISNALLGGTPIKNSEGQVLQNADGSIQKTRGVFGDFAENNLSDSPLLGFGKGNLSWRSVFEGGVDSTISAGVNSAVYGTDFSDSLRASFVQSLVFDALADVQNEIGGLGKKFEENGSSLDRQRQWEGSLGHAVLHGLAGCAAAAATDASCASGAAVGVAQSIFAGQQTAPDRDDYASDEAYGLAYSNWQTRVSEHANLLGAAVGFFTSGGEAANVSNGAKIAQSGAVHNYLTHAQILDFSKALRDCANLGSDFNACRAEVLAAYVKTSAKQNKDLAACETDACRADHLAKIAVAEGAFQTILSQLMTSGDYRGWQLANLQHSESDKIDWSPSQKANFRTALRKETTATFCSGNVSSCHISVRSELEGYGALTAQEQQSLHDERLEIYLEMERQARAKIAERVCSSSMTETACSRAVDHKIERDRRNDNRVSGAIDVAFGAVEIAGAVYLCGQSSGTLCTAASAALGVHGVDMAQAGIRQVVTGEQALPLGVRLMMQATGMDQFQASLAYELASAGVSLAAIKTVAARGPQALAKQHARVVKATNSAVKPITVSTDVKTWNQFQSATKGQFVSRADAAKGWDLYKQANGIQTGTVRSQAAKSFFLKQLGASGKAPKWMNQYLSNGKVPPGYHVDHLTPISVGGADSPLNMRLKDIATHVTRHKYYRPWE